MAALRSGSAATGSGMTDVLGRATAPFGAKLLQAEPIAPCSATTAFHATSNRLRTNPSGSAWMAARRAATRVDRTEAFPPECDAEPAREPRPKALPERANPPSPCRQGRQALFIPNWALGGPSERWLPLEGEDHSAGDSSTRRRSDMGWPAAVFAASWEPHEIAVPHGKRSGSLTDSSPASPRRSGGASRKEVRGDIAPGLWSSERVCYRRGLLMPLKAAATASGRIRPNSTSH